MSFICRFFLLIILKKYGFCRSTASRVSTAAALLLHIVRMA